MMIGEKFSWLAFTSSLFIIAGSLIAELTGLSSLSIILLGSALVTLLLFSWISRKLKEELILFEYEEEKWGYFFSSLLALLLLIFVTIVNSYTIFFALPIPRIIVTLLMGIIIMLVLYTVLTIPTLEKRFGYWIFFIISIFFTIVVIGSQLHLGISIPSFLWRFRDPIFIINIALIFEVLSLVTGGEMSTPTTAVTNIYERARLRRERPFVWRREIVYITIVAFISLFIITVVATTFGLPGVTPERWPWTYVIIFLAISLLAVLVLFIIFIFPERKGLIKEKYEKEAIYRILLLSTSAVVATIFLVIAVMLQMKMITSLGTITLTQKNSIDFAIFAILTLIGPYSFYEYARFRKIDRMEERFPEFLRDLTESRKSGMTMARAVETSAKGDYGYLTPEIRKMATQISWGSSFTEALKLFAERLKTPLIERSTSLVIKASESGGRISDVIEAAARDSREIKILQADRRIEMKMYLLIIYVAFFVFLAVIAILSASFIPKLIGATQQAGGLPGMGGGGEGMSLWDYQFLYICISLVQAIGSGLVGGVFGEGNIPSGLRHGFIMVLITYVIFKLIL